MANDCSVTIPGFKRENADLDVIKKYEALMCATLGDGSLYARAKDTMFYQFKDLQLTEKEKAGLIAEFMQAVAVDLSKISMSSAVVWAKEERDGGYANALVRAQTAIAAANVVEAEAKICLVDSQISKMCADIEATLATSLRDNGAVDTYKQEDGKDSCKPNTLKAEGLKFEQTKQVQAATYQTFADAYRKSGVVKIHLDGDNFVKGYDGNTHKTDGTLAGYTAQQTENAERQRIAYEDSKLNHAANSSAAMIGQMLSAEVQPAKADVQRWREALDGLLVKHSSTNKK